MKNRFIFNKPFYLLVAVLLLQNFLSLGQIQNPYWYFPPYYVDFTTTAPTVSSLFRQNQNNPSKTIGANGINNTSGVPTLYKTNEFLVCPDRYTTLPGLDDILSDPFYEQVIIPVPNECDKYYIFSVDDPDIGARTFKENQVTIFSNGYYHLSFYTGSNTSTAFTHPEKATFAASRSFLDQTSSAMAYLYVNEGDDTKRIRRLKVTSTGVTYDQDITTTKGATAYEMELSHDQRYLAFGFVESGVPKVRVLSVVSINSYQDYYIPGVTSGFISGVEFSQDGTSIFASVSNTGKIHKIVLSNGAVSEVGSSAGLGTSQLELAYDNYIYASNGSQLKGFDPNATSPTITKTISVNNPLSGSIYTLVDQIDGLNYNDPYSVLSSYWPCQPLKVYSNVSSTGGLPTITQNYEVIKTTGSVVVNSGAYVVFSAGSSIDIEEGFEAVEGSSFSASIQNCATSVPIANCSSTLRPAEHPIDVANRSDIVLSPNPSSGQFSVQCNFRIGENVSGEISNSQGEKIFSLTADMFEGGNLNLNMESYPKGLYFLKINNGNEQYGKKVVIE